MTYEERFMTAKTFDELKDMAVESAKVAMFLNPDRLKPIEEALNKVAEAKGWKGDENNGKQN
jgi:hypothetical protein